MSADLKVCFICGIKYTRKTRTKKAWVTSKFCSKKCMGIARVGTHPSKETREKQSNAKKGYKQTEEHKKHASHPAWNKGLPATEQQLKCLSQKGKSYSKGENHWNWTGGKKVSWMRHTNKRNRELGFDLINEPINDDEVAHHITKEFVAYVPAFINRSCYHNIHTGKNMDEVNFYTLNYLFLVYNKEN